MTAFLVSSTWSHADYSLHANVFVAEVPVLVACALGEKGTLEVFAFEGGGWLYRSLILCQVGKYNIPTSLSPIFWGMKNFK